MGIAREIHKKTNQVIFNAQRKGSKRAYSKVTYIAQNENGERVEISASEYRFFLPCYSEGDTILDRADFKKIITKLTRKSKNVVIAEITITYTKQVGVNAVGDTKVWTEEFDGRIV